MGWGRVGNLWCYLSSMYLASPSCWVTELHKQGRGRRGCYHLPCCFIASNASSWKEDSSPVSFVLSPERHFNKAAPEVSVFKTLQALCSPDERSGRERKDSHFTVCEWAQTELHNARNTRAWETQVWMLKWLSRDSMLEEQQKWLSTARFRCILELLR